MLVDKNDAIPRQLKTLNDIFTFSRIKNDGEHIKVEEDKVKVIWSAALIEKWLVHHSHREISVTSYDVTIFPAESSRNSVTKVLILDSESGLFGII